MAGNRSETRAAAAGRTPRLDNARPPRSFGIAAGIDRIYVLDPNRLAAGIIAAVERDFSGNLSAAARAIGVTQSTLHRLAYSPGRIRQPKADLLERVNALVYKELQIREVVSASIPRPPGVLRDYRKWLRFAVEKCRESSPSLMPRMVRRKDAPIGEDANGRRALFRVARARARSIGEYAALVREVSRTHSPQRALLAEYRILSPLLDSWDSCGIERGVDELGSGKGSEFYRFIQAGVDRERILMKRASDEKREQALTGTLFGAIMKSMGHAPAQGAEWESGVLIREHEDSARRVRQLGRALVARK